MSHTAEEVGKIGKGAKGGGKGKKGGKAKAKGQKGKDDTGKGPADAKACIDLPRAAAAGDGQGVFPRECGFEQLGQCVASAPKGQARVLLPGFSLLSTWRVPLPQGDLC